MGAVQQLIASLVFTAVYAFMGAVILRMSARWVLRENLPLKTVFNATWLAGVLAFLLMLPVVTALASLGDDVSPWAFIAAGFAVFLTAQAASNKVLFECSVLSAVLIALMPILIIFGLLALVIVGMFALFFFGVP